MRRIVGIAVVSLACLAWLSSAAAQPVRCRLAYGAGIGILVDAVRQGESVVYRARSTSAAVHQVVQAEASASPSVSNAAAA